MPRIVPVFLSTLLAFGSAGCAQTQEPAAVTLGNTPPGKAAPPPLEVASLFGENAGCVVLRDLATGEERRGGALCDTPLSPCSTFKIPNALIGLDAGLIEDEKHLFAWDGVKRWRDTWNKDQDLAEAMRTSCVPCFQELARKIGGERMQSKIDAFSYGNRDLSTGVDTFWLGASLQITPREQARFLADLWLGRLPASPEAAATVQRIVRQGGGDGWSWSGKTGSCVFSDGKTPPHGWFVGEAEHGGRKTTFAVVEQGKEALGPRSRDHARRLLIREGLLPAAAE